MPEGFAIDWLVVLLVGGIGVAAILGMFMTSFMIAPKRPSALKDIPYECGIQPAPYSWSQLHIRYYIFAILFLIFDVEAVFLFPWAVTLGKIGVFGFWSMMIFLTILTIGFIYEWRKGALEWE